MKRPKYHQPAELKDIISAIPFKLDFYRFMIGYHRYLEEKMLRARVGEKTLSRELEALLVWSVRLFNDTHDPIDMIYGVNVATINELARFHHAAFALNQEYLLEQEQLRRQQRPSR